MGFDPVSLPRGPVLASVHTGCDDFQIILDLGRRNILRFQSPSSHGQQFIDNDTYNRFLTVHGVIMIFLFVIPGIPAVFGNFFLPIMIGADLQRPAAVEQLRTLGRQIDVPVFSDPELENIRHEASRLAARFDDEYWRTHDDAHEFPWEFYDAFAEQGKRLSRVDGWNRQPF